MIVPVPDRPRVGGGPRYQILSHIFARCVSQKTHGHARIARVFFDSRNVQKSVTQIIYLGRLPNPERSGRRVDGAQRCCW